MLGPGHIMSIFGLSQTVCFHYLFKHTGPLSNAEQWFFTSARTGLYSFLAYSLKIVSVAG